MVQPVPQPAHSDHHRQSRTDDKQFTDADSEDKEDSATGNESKQTPCEKFYLHDKWENGKLNNMLISSSSQENIEIGNYNTQFWQSDKASVSAIISQPQRAETPRE